MDTEYSTLPQYDVSIFVYAVSALRTEGLKIYNLCINLVNFVDMTPLPPHDQRHLWLRYQVEGYIEEIMYDFEQRLETIFGRQVNRVHILDFEGLTPDMRQHLAEKLRMVYTRDDGQELGRARHSMTWRQFILALGLHTTKEMAEDRFEAY
ncbi:hypothetical protein Tco_0737930 [Tanacetum coccineum]